MALFSLLTKELRSRMRRERTVWLLVIYIMILGLAGWIVVQTRSYTAPSGDGLNTTGTVLYYTLAILQILLIVFITPAFTATAINSEKERQTYDLLLCSQLSGLQLATGKLIAGLISALFLIAASIPLFSMLLFFGGIDPLSLLVVLVIYTVTALLIGSGGLLCSIILPRPALSTALAYVINLLWLGSPLIALYLWPAFTHRSLSMRATAFLISWSPVAAVTTVPASAGQLGILDFGNHVTIPLWIGYSCISLLLAAIFFIVSFELARPNAISVFARKVKRQASLPTSTKAALRA